MATSSEQFCTLCHQSHLTVHAVEFCEEFLCIDCKKHHMMSKLSKFHIAISIQDYQELPSFVQSGTGRCREHDKCFEMYCTDHGCPCCVKCLFMHRECTGLESMIDVIKDSKVSTSVLDLKQTLNDMIDYAKRITDKLLLDIATTLNQKSTLLTEIKEARNTINDYLKSIENTILAALSKIVDQNVGRIQSLISEISESKERLDFISDDINKTTRYASDFQVLIALKEIESLVNAEEQFLSSLHEKNSLDFIDISFNSEELLKQITSITTFGDIEELMLPCDLILLKKKNKQAQILTPVSKTINDISLSLYTTFEIQTTVNLKGCSILPAENYVVSNYNTNSRQDSVSVKQMDGIQRTLKCICKQNYDVNDFVVLTDTSVVATSGHEKRFLFIVDYIHDVLLKQIPVSGPTCGITDCGRTVMYCVYGKGIEKNYNLDTGAMQMILKNEQLCNSYVAYSDNHLYFTYADAVACCDVAGNISWTFENKHTLKAPRGIAVDKNGYLYVAGEQSENVVVISPSGKESRQLLGREGGLVKPRALKYDQENHRLLVCNVHTHLFVFDIN